MTTAEDNVGFEGVGREPDCVFYLLLPWQFPKWEKGRREKGWLKQLGPG